MSGQRVIILGAGLGRRMGGPKVLKSFQGKTFLERILDRCEESRSPVILTHNPQSHSPLEALLDGFLHSTLPRLVSVPGEATMLDSLRAGLEAGDPSGGFWCWPVDAPFISPRGWQQATAAANSDPGAIWKLRVAGKTGHPIWFPGWAAPGIIAGNWPRVEERGLLGFLDQHQDKVRILALEGELLADFNSPDQLAALEGEHS